MHFCRPLGTTFKGKYGSVDYWVKASLERPACPTQQVKKRFEVMDPVDVNTPELLVSPEWSKGLGGKPLGRVSPTLWHLGVFNQIWAERN